MGESGEIRVHWLATFATGERFWSGTEPLTLDGATYLAAAFIELSAVETGLNQPRRRLTARFDVSHPELREHMLVDAGPVTIEIGWVASMDHGLTWQRVPRRFVGRLSRPTIQDGVYTAELETYQGTVDRGRPLTWSDEAQRQRFADDLGFAYLQRYASGLETRWPP